MEMLIDKTYRGSLYVSELTLKKNILYALKNIASRFFITDLHPFIVDDAYLHIELAGLLQNDAQISDVVHDLNQNIKDELFHSLGIKPKNIAIFFSLDSEEKKNSKKTVK